MEYGIRNVTVRTDGSEELVDSSVVTLKSHMVMQSVTKKPMDMSTV